MWKAKIYFRLFNCFRNPYFYVRDLSFSLHLLRSSRSHRQEERKNQNIGGITSGLVPAVECLRCFVRVGATSSNGIVGDAVSKSVLVVSVELHREWSGDHLAGSS